MEDTMRIKDRKKNAKELRGLQWTILQQAHSLLQLLFAEGFNVNFVDRSAKQLLSRPPSPSPSRANNGTAICFHATVTVDS